MADNYRLLNHLSELSLNERYFVLSALSRKTMIGAATGQQVAAERVVGSVTAAFFSMEQHAQIVRVHDVKETYQALQIYQALREYA